MKTNEKLIGVFIKATPENRKELKEFWEANSECARLHNYDYTLTSPECYGLSKDEEFGAIHESIVLNEGYKILTLPEAKALISEYPKVMWVWDYDENKAFKRVVFMEKNNHYLAWVNVKTIKDAEKEIMVTAWRNAKDIEHEVIEVTLEEIAELKGCFVDQLRIKE